MATNFNYAVNVDTSKVAGAMTEIRSQIGMAMNSPTGLAFPAMGMGGGGFSMGSAGMSGFGDLVSGGASGFGQMMQGLSRHQTMGPMIAMGGTFTNPAIAYTPHYGVITAQSQLNAERQLANGGLAVAGVLAPPGVGAHEYFVNTMGQSIERGIEARQQAEHAGMGAFASTGGGMVAGMAAGALGQWAGEKVIGGVLKKHGFAEAAHASGLSSTGRLIRGAGAIGLSFLAWDAAQEYVGDKIQSHYNEVEQTHGIMKELGGIAGGGRGLSPGVQAGLGVAAYGISKDLRMDVRQVGDILSGSRAFGLLPSSTDPNEFRKQGTDLASAITDIAAALHTSLAGAMSKLKQYQAEGLGAREGVIRDVGREAADPGGYWRGIGAAGTSYANQNMLAGRQGFDLFTSGVRAMSNAPMSREEMRLMGGARGAGMMAGAAVMQAVQSPGGDMQLMAAMGGGELGDPFENAMSAMSAMSEGGDVVGNMMSFNANRGRYRRGLSSSGMKTMARNQIDGVVEMLSGISPNASQSDLRINAAMQLGYAGNDDAARSVVHGIYSNASGGIGTGRKGAVLAAQLEAAQTFEFQAHSRASGISAPTKTLMDHLTDVSMPDDTLSNWVIGGAVAGAAYFGAGGLITGGALTIPGAIAGGVGGAAYKLSDYVTNQWWGGVEFSGTAEEKAQHRLTVSARTYEDKLDALKQEKNITGLNSKVAGVAAFADFKNTELDTSGFMQSEKDKMGRVIKAAEIKSVPKGPGTIKFDGNYYPIEELQKTAKGPLVGRTDGFGGNLPLAAATVLGKATEGFLGEGEGASGTILQHLTRGSRTQVEAWHELLIDPKIIKEHEDARDKWTNTTNPSRYYRGRAFPGLQNWLESEGRSPKEASTRDLADYAATLSQHPAYIEAAKLAEKGGASGGSKYEPEEADALLAAAQANLSEAPRFAGIPQTLNAVTLASDLNTKKQITSSLSEKPKAKRRSSSGRDNAIGFGEIESALTTINKTLRLTEKSMRVLQSQLPKK